MLENKFKSLYPVQMVFACEFITPASITGADGKTFELREQSIKGALRFWFRALNGHESLEEMHQKENNIFGCSGSNGKGIIKSKVKLLVVNASSPKPVEKGIENQYILLKGVNNREYNTGKFKVEVNISSEEIVEDVLKSFWCLFYLGGLGTRGRKFGGNLSCILVNIEDLKEKYPLATVFSQDKDCLDDYIKCCFEKIEINPMHGHECTEFCTLNNAQVLLSKEFSDVKTPLSLISNLYKKYLKETVREDDKKIIDQVKRRGRCDQMQLKRPQFGLPASYLNIYLEGAIHSRSASSLFFRMIQYKNKYYTCMINFNTALLETSKDEKVFEKSLGFEFIDDKNIKLKFVEYLKKEDALKLKEVSF